MGDHEDGAFVFDEKILQPGDDVVVHVVGGFVQDEQLRAGGENGGHGDSLSLAARKVAHPRFKIADPQLRHHGAAGEIRRVRSDLRHVFFRLLTGGEISVVLRVLRKIGCADAVCVDDFSAVRLLNSGDDPQQRGFSCAVDSDQSDFFPFVDAQADVPEQRLFRIAFIYLICVYQYHVRLFFSVNFLGFMRTRTLCVLEFYAYSSFMRVRCGRRRRNAGRALPYRSVRLFNSIAEKAAEIHRGPASGGRLPPEETEDVPWRCIVSRDAGRRDDADRWEI